MGCCQERQALIVSYRGSTPTVTVYRKPIVTTASRTLRTVVQVGVAAALAACSSTTTSDGGPVLVELSADQTTVVAGSKLPIDYTASGQYLSGVIIQYGDGLLDSIPLYGAQSASGRVQHTWDSAGTYTVRAEAIDPTQGSATDQLSVSVSAPAGGA